MTLLWVMIAGGLGSGSRYLLGRWALSAFGAAFPYGPLIVNLAGCFALGVVVQLASTGVFSPEVRTAIAVGFLGGFTTYSSFNQDTIALFSSGAVGAAAGNIAITLAGGLVAGALGATAGRLLTS
jgi:fluoride exporter